MTFSLGRTFSFYILLTLSLLFFDSAQAQFEEIDIYQTQIDPVSGIKVLSADSSYSINFRFRMQNRFEAEADDISNPFGIDRHVFLTRRFRLRSDGYVVNKSFRYAFQLSFTQGDQDFATTRTPNLVRDAMVFYKPNNHLEIGFGLTKLPGNRQRVISSGEQQFADRSILNSMMSIDRDHGVFFRFKDDKARIPYRLHAAWSNGTGRNFDEKSGGSALSGKIEVLPFGTFKFNGDYFDGDFVGEKSPKLSLSMAYSHNKNAIRTGGQTGPGFYSGDQTDINSFFMDALFKYKGFATFAEFAHRDASNPISLDEANPGSKSLYVNRGIAGNLQLSYQNRAHHEVGFRWARFLPHSSIQHLQAELNDFTLVYTKYVRFHRVKIQADITYRNAISSASSVVAPTQDYWLYRFQIEMGI